MSVKSDNYPVGATLMLAGTLPENGNWLLCDGTQLNVADYPELFKAIGYTYGGGGDDKAVFNIPNYLGQFLRGAAHDSDADPNKNIRAILNTDGETETSGVGTAQSYGTKIPNSTHFSASFLHLPTSSKTTHGITMKRNSGYNGSPSKNQSTCTSGGDKESRPKNIYLKMYIKSRTSV